MTTFADRPDTPKPPTTESVPSHAKEPWVSPSLEDLDVAEFTQAMPGMGGDGGVANTNLS